MKIKLAVTTIGLLFSFAGFSQDSVSGAQNKVTLKSRNTTLQQKDKQVKKGSIYRPTRLGSSSPMYNTYKKNDYGAGGVTTDPDKAKQGSATVNPADAGRNGSQDFTTGPGDSTDNR